MKKSSRLSIQQILNNEGLENIQVKHNHTLPLKSGSTAQFDIYWEFKQAGVLHRVAVECKYYNSNVDIGKIHEFASKLEGVGNVRGIMVTRKGFQSGAKAEARHKGINLKVFQLPEDMDWSGRLRKIVFQMHALCLNNVRPHFAIDKEWFKQQGIDSNFVKEEFGALTTDIIIQDEDGRRIGSIHEISNSLERPEAGGKDLKALIEYPQNTFLQVPNAPLLKLKAIAFTYDVEVLTETIEIDGDQVIHGLLIDDDTNESFLYRFDGSVVPRTPLEEEQENG